MPIDIRIPPKDYASMDRTQLLKLVRRGIGPAKVELDRRGPPPPMVRSPVHRGRL